MKTKKIYLSGPITQNNNAPYLFADAEERYQKLGIVINPLKLNKNKTSWYNAMRKDIALLLECDIIVMLPGWTKSKGAKIEHFIAKSLDYQCIYDNKAEQENIHIIFRIIEDETCITVKQIRSKSRKQDFAFLRHIICYILYNYFDYSITSIAEQVNRDHATVINSIKVVSNELTYPSKIKKLYDRIITKLNNVIYVQ